MTARSLLAEAEARADRAEAALRRIRTELEALLDEDNEPAPEPRRRAVEATNQEVPK